MQITQSIGIQNGTILLFLPYLNRIPNAKRIRDYIETNGQHSWSGTCAIRIKRYPERRHTSSERK